MMDTQDNKLKLALLLQGDDEYNVHQHEQIVAAVVVAAVVVAAVVVAAVVVDRSKNTSVRRRIIRNLVVCACFCFNRNWNLLNRYSKPKLSNLMSGF